MPLQVRKPSQVWAMLKRVAHILQYVLHGVLATLLFALSLSFLHYKPDVGYRSNEEDYYHLGIACGCALLFVAGVVTFAHFIHQG